MTSHPSAFPANALAKWPNVPACYDWLSLDRRGRWRLQGQPVSHGGLIDFLNRHYGHDEAGHWFVQNGPQRVYVALEYTPWVLRRTNETADTGFSTHTGQVVAAVDRVFLDEEGNLLLSFPDGIGLLHDGDLPALLGELRNDQDQPPEEDQLLALMTGTTPLPAIFWRGQPVERLCRATVGPRFGFIAAPQAQSE